MDGGAWCAAVHAKFRLKLKKVGETTRPFRYDLNKIPYDYTVEMTNRFKGLDQIDRLLLPLKNGPVFLDPSLFPEKSEACTSR